METDGLPTPDNTIFGEIQVLLAEKRTALAGLRTGIAVFALPLSVLSALIATSRYYSIERGMPLLLMLPLMLLNLGLVVLGTWLVFRSVHRIETRSFPSSLATTHRGFTFYVADPVSSIHHFEHRRELSGKYRSLAEFIR
jgi:uncharacterized membrane protein YidH (DUF202 family)